MQREQFDIFISGAGLSGLIAACAFGAKGFSVLCVDPTPPITNVKSGDADRRSTAFLQPARTTLEAAGIWPRLAPFAAPLEIMRLADAGGVIVRNASGALSLAYTAAGRFLGYTEAHMNSWDCLAGQLLIAEAGKRWPEWP